MVRLGSDEHHYKISGRKGTPVNEMGVVPGNIQTPTTEGIGNSKGVGGSEAQEIPKGRGVGP